MYLFPKGRFQVIGVVATLWLSVLILVNTTIYFRSGKEPVFLVENGRLADGPFWRTAFYGIQVDRWTGMMQIFDQGEWQPYVPWREQKLPESTGLVNSPDRAQIAETASRQRLSRPRTERILSLFSTPSDTF